MAGSSPGTAPALVDESSRDWQLWMELARAIQEEGDPRPLWEQSLRRLREVGGLSAAVVVLRSAGSWQVIGHQGADLGPWLDPLLTARAGSRRLEVATGSADERSLLAALGCDHALWQPFEFPGETVGGLLVGGDRAIDAALEPTLQGLVAVLGMQPTARTVRGPDGAADATDQRLVEQRLRASEARWRALASHAPDLIMWLDMEGRIQYSNRGAWGRDAAALSGHAVEELLPADSRAAWRTALASASSLGASQETSCEVCTSTSPAESQWMSFLLGPVHEGERGVVVVGRDVSDKRQTEARLMVSDRMVAVGMLASGVAHEINNPLTAIATNLELAQAELARLGPDASADLSEMLSDAYQAAGRVQAIVRDLKIFSRAEEERSRPTDLHEVLETTVRLAWNEIRHRARLVRDYQPVGMVAGNEARLGQVFLNLILNAAQAIPEGNAAQNEIRLQLRPAGPGQVEVRVEDTGTGMAPEVQRRLFTPFFTTKPVGVGTGLGLTICRRIIESHHGEITIESEPGRGTSVRVVLPLSVSAAMPTVSRPPPAPVRRGKVLVLDDEPVITTVVRRILGAQHEVTVSHYGGEVLAAIERGERYDLLFCDLMMPEMTGMDFYEQLERRWPEQAERVVFLTGGAFTTRAREFLDQVTNLRLEKPFSAKVLRSVVVDHLAGLPPTPKP